jgi:Tautomerase enzyme
MPSTRIVTGEWARGREVDLIGAVQSALEASIRIPDWDRDIVVDVYGEVQRNRPTGSSDRYTRIEIGLYAGRSMDAKRAMYRAIVGNLSALGVPDTEIKIIVVEFPRENCAPVPHKGMAASDIDIGYAVEV